MNRETLETRCRQDIEDAWEPYWDRDTIAVGPLSRRVRNGMEGSLIYSFVDAAKAVLKQFIEEADIDLDELDELASESVTDQLKWVSLSVAETTKRWVEDDDNNERAFSRERAELIAITEITRSRSAGELAAAELLEDLDIKVTGAWMTRQDELVCSICGPLHMTPESYWREFFPNGSPAHPRCRCGLSWKEKAGRKKAAKRTKKVSRLKGSKKATKKVSRLKTKKTATKKVGRMRRRSVAESVEDVEFESTFLEGGKGSGIKGHRTYRPEPTKEAKTFADDNIKAMRNRQGMIDLRTFMFGSASDGENESYQQNVGSSHFMGSPTDRNGEVKYKTMLVDPKAIRNATQFAVVADRVQYFVDNPGAGYDDEMEIPKLVIHRGAIYVHDGHHRVMAAKLLGVKDENVRILARVVDDSREPGLGFERFKASMKEVDDEPVAAVVKNPDVKVPMDQHAMIPKPPKVGAATYQSYQKKMDAIHEAATRGDLAGVNAIETNATSKTHWTKKTHQYKQEVLAAMAAKPVETKSPSAKQPAPTPGRASTNVPHTFETLHRGVAKDRGPNDYGVAGKGEYWSGSKHVAESYAGNGGEVKTTSITLNKPLAMNYSELNALQTKLYGRPLTGFEPELSAKFDKHLRDEGHDGVILYDPEISKDIPQEVVKLAPVSNAIPKAPAPVVAAVGGKGFSDAGLTPSRTMDAVEALGGSVKGQAKDGSLLVVNSKGKQVVTTAPEVAKEFKKQVLAPLDKSAMLRREREWAYSVRKSTATIGEVHEGSLSEFKAMVGDRINPATLIGAPDDSEVEIARFEGGEGFLKDTFVITASNDDVYMSRTIQKRRDGTFVMNNNELEVSEDRKGLGRKILKDQIAAAKSIGVSKIVTQAAGEPDAEETYGQRANGYYTWGRYGYDTKITSLDSEATRKDVAKKFPKAVTLSDIFATEEGRKYWRENGTAFTGTFDLTTGSRSMQTFTAYLVAKGEA